MANLSVNNIYNGFKLTAIKNIKELATEAFLFTHEKTKAKLLFLENEDDNKVFSISLEHHRKIILVLLILWSILCYVVQESLI